MRRSDRAVVVAGQDVERGDLASRVQEIAARGAAVRLHELPELAGLRQKIGDEALRERAHR